MPKKITRVFWRCSNGHEHTDKELALRCERKIGMPPLDMSRATRDMKALELSSHAGISLKMIGSTLGYKGGNRASSARFHILNGQRLCEMRERTPYFYSIVRSISEKLVEVRV